MATYFTSDLHIKEDHPHIAGGFVEFLSKTTEGADAVYVLGDLFEYWIGDDAAPLLGVQSILSAMKKRAMQTPCYFIAGNRDFLVRDGFEQASGFTILPDETVVDLYGTPTLLLHGDSLCADDLAHQKFRSEMVTNTVWCDGFLKQPIEQRIKMAQEARAQSHEHKASVSMSIMDVNQDAVLNAFTQYGVSNMIHGHTHRQQVHDHGIKNDNPLIRTVLGDWGTHNSVLTVTPESQTLSNALLK